ncbi:ankyrin repeat domain-containing protein [Caldibacillus lycopersici]|uniref:Ankyrin repeat domain-containing protein n=1 Tax=Perspicuibacillus lycopersici TaxID=1325689 RepID=A0AAE3LRI7_9BACI|nr:ankyrin repeat domain-containing protein [Perspicuibacillus lycopersici]MCU9614709.1 ankyrin repeat domain-containing protein [Perspicuibacillus lycopersici]
MQIYEDNPLAVALINAIHNGDLAALTQLLLTDQQLANIRIIEKNNENITRSLLHIVTDWPGHLPNGAATVELLVQAGADVNARISESHTETPLHWAASCDDIDVLDALIDAGANIEASGAVIAGGTPLDDAVAFAQWKAAHRLVDRGAKMALWHAAALGKIDAIEAHFAGEWLSNQYPWGASSTTTPDAITVSFWCACHGSQLHTAKYLLARGAALNWISVWDGLTPLDAALRSGAADLVDWLKAQGAKAANEL